MEKVISIISKLGFEEVPDYGFMIKLLKEAIEDNFFVNDNRFEWNPLPNVNESLDKSILEENNEGLNT